MTAPAKTARQQLGDALTYYIRDRQLSLNDVARRCRASVREVESWTHGVAVPRSDQWNTLINGVHRSLRGYAEIYRRARDEADAEAESLRAAARALAARHAPQVSTPLAPKLAAALEAQTAQPMPKAPDPVPGPTPGPTTEPTPTPPARPIKRNAQSYEDLGVPIEGAPLRANGRIARLPAPPGSLAQAQRARRRELVRQILRARPTAPARGPDGILSIVRKTYGIGIDPDEIRAIRAEVYAERQSGQPPHSPQQEPALPTTPAPPPNPSAAANESDISDGVELIVQAIPGLRRLVIEVADDGNVSYDYEVRTVRTGGGKLKR